MTTRIKKQSSSRIGSLPKTAATAKAFQFAAWVSILLLPWNMLAFRPSHGIDGHGGEAVSTVREEMSSHSSANHPGQAEGANQRKASEGYHTLPLRFEANLGQSDPRVKFLSRGAGYTLFLTQTAAVLTLQESRPEHKSEELVRDPSRTAPPQASTTSAVLHMQLLHANPQAAMNGADELPGKTNYFRGKDPKRWHTNIPSYGKVLYRDVYPGVDMVYSGNHGQLEYSFVVAAGADPRGITMMFSGARQLRLDSGSGDLLVKAGREQLRFQQPVAYQMDSVATATAQQSSILASKHLVGVRYVVHSGNLVTFQLAPYDHGEPIIIDPTLAYSTYLGGSKDDYGTSVAVDSSGDAYVTGYTSSADFPVTSGAFQTTCGGECQGGTSDAFITKFDPSGSTLIYSTYLGGTENDYGNGIALDADNNAYIVGETFSSDFPVTAGVFQASCGGGSCVGGDIFVTELNSDGSGLIYSTYLGGRGSNQGNAIALDASNNAFITGFVESLDFPVTAGAFQTTCRCSSLPDAFVTELNSKGSALVYSTYLGGSKSDVGYAIALDSADDAFVTGYTSSTDFPITPGAFRTTLQADKAAFVTKLNPSGSALVYSTYLGGYTKGTTPCEACGTGIALNGAGEAYVSGLTAEADFPVTPGAFQTQRMSKANGHNSFITEFNSTGTDLIFSTYLGGEGDTGATSIGVDSSGNVWVKGNTKAADFPVTPGAFQLTLAGEYDSFVSELNPTGSALLYSTYLGGSGDEYGGATHMLALGTQDPPAVYVVGYTGSTNFPVTVGAFQTQLAGANNAFVSRFAPSPNVGFSPATIGFGDQSVGTSSAPQTVTVTNTGNTDLNISTVTVTGADSADFVVVNDCAATVLPQGTCTVSVSFSPSRVGAEKANLTLNDNAPDSPQAIRLTGTGTSSKSAVGSDVERQVKAANIDTFPDAKEFHFRFPGSGQ